MEKWIKKMESKVAILPELKSPYFADAYQNPRYIRDFPLEQGKDFIYHIMNRMGMENGGMSYFYHEHEKEAILQAWVNGLQQYTGRQLLNTLHEVLAGNISKTPRTTMEFKQLMQHGTHHRLAPSVAETRGAPTNAYMQLGYTDESTGEVKTEARIRSEAIRADHIAQCKAMLPKAKPKNGGPRSLGNIIAAAMEKKI